MRRYLFIVLFLAVLVAPFVLRQWVTRGVPASSSRGASDAVTLVIVTPHNDDIRHEFARAFNEWHRAKYNRPVKLDYRTTGGSNDIKRLVETTYSEIRSRHGGKLPADESDVRSGLDIVWGGGDDMFNRELKPTGVLRPITLDPTVLASAFPQQALAGVSLYDTSKTAAGNPAPLWIGVCLSSFGIIYNPDLYRTLDLPPPRTWADLTNPKLSGLISLADPAHSGSAAVAYMMIIQRAMADTENEFFAGHSDVKAMPKSEWSKNPGYNLAIARGWKNGIRQLTRIAANTRYFTDSSTLVNNDVGSGDAAAGMSIDFYGRVTQESLGADRCRFVSPAAATAITPDPVAILYGVSGEKRETAMHFVEFLISREGQLLWILKVGEPGGPQVRSLRRPPIRADLYGDRSGWADDTDPFKEAGGFNQRGEWLATMSDLRSLWVSAWIDDRDALLDAYAEVLKVKDFARREALLADLVDLPLDLPAVEKIGAERKKRVAAGGEVDKWKAEQRIEWTKKFAEHYHAVKRRAAGGAS